MALTSKRGMQKCPSLPEKTFLVKMSLFWEGYEFRSWCLGMWLAAVRGGGMGGRAMGRKWFKCQHPGPIVPPKAFAPRASISRRAHVTEKPSDLPLFLRLFSSLLLPSHSGHVLVDVLKCFLFPPFFPYFCPVQSTKRRGLVWLHSLIIAVQ